MDKSVQVFNFEQQKIDVIEIDGYPWFIGKQIANILGYENGSRDINRHVDEEDRQVITKKELSQMVSNQETTETVLSIFGESAMGGVQRLTLINESGLYSLIFSSKLESAKKFNRWVTHEVLPSIRKTGKYEVKQSREELIANALVAANEVIAEYQKKTKHLQKTVEVMAPKAHVWDKIVDDDGHISWRNACNLIRSPEGIVVKENVIRRRLVDEEGWMYKAAPGVYRPYKSAMDAGYMKVKLAQDKYGKYYPCNFFTTKGIQKLLEMFSPTGNDFEDGDD